MNERQMITKGELAAGNIDLIDKGVSRDVMFSETTGALQFRNMLEVMEFAKLMSTAGTAVPQHLRGNPGACLAISVQAAEWNFSPFAVANKSYSVNDRIAYESQLIHAVVEARAPLRERLKVRYDGDGDDLVCFISGHFVNEVDPVEYESPAKCKIHPQNSPLWKTDPRQQLFYYSVRAWCRRFCPDVLLGVYAKDEIEDNPPAAIAQTNDAEALRERLAASEKTGEGFTGDKIVEQTLSGDIIQPGDKAKDVTPKKSRKNVTVAKKSTTTKEAPQPETKPVATEAATVQAVEPKQSAPPESSAKTKAKPSAQATPTDVETYTAHVAAWVMKMEDADEIEAKWTSELPLRRACKVNHEAREKIREDHIDPRVADLNGA